MTWLRNILLIIFGGGIALAASLDSTTPTELKAEVNQKLNQKMATNVDYTASIQAMQPVITELGKKGWVFSSSKNKICAFERKYKVLITRTPEHQDVAEKRGEVAIGDNTYESGIYQTTRCTDKYGEQRIDIDFVTATGNAALDAFNFGEKSANWLQDL